MAFMVWQKFEQIHRYPDDARAWTQSKDCNHRLIGLACGPSRLTLTGKEEDEFPLCDTIDTPARMCGPDVSTMECAQYMGDGW